MQLGALLVYIMFLVFFLFFFVVVLSETVLLPIFGALPIQLFDCAMLNLNPQFLNCGLGNSWRVDVPHTLVTRDSGHVIGGQ